MENDRKFRGGDLFPAGVLLSALLFSAWATNYTLTVDAGTKGSAWSRFYEKCVSTCHVYTVLSSAYGRNIQNALQRAHDEAGFQYFRGHGILNDDVKVYSETGGVASYNWTNFDKIYDAALAAGMKPILEISFMPPALATDAGNLSLWYNGITAVNRPPKDWNKWHALITALVTHCEEKWGVDEVRKNWYFEVWNEPEWMYSGMADYPLLYAHTCGAILAADAQVKVGGPAYTADAAIPSGITNFIDYVKNNNNPLTGTKNLKIDFISYHRYSNNANYGGMLSAPNSQNDFHKAVVTACKGKGFAGEILCDEWGSTYNQTVDRDDETSASFYAKTICMLNGNGASYPPPSMYGYWCLSDIYEENNAGTNTCYDEGNYGMMVRGDSRYQDSWDLAKPVFNACKLLHRMGDYSLPLAGATTSDGVGGCATVSANGNAVQILLYNHVNGAAANSATQDNVTLTVNNIPWAPGPVKVEHLIVDRTRSNTYRAWADMGKPQNPTQAQWTQLKTSEALANQDPETTTSLTDKTWTKTFTQNYYSVGLVTLSNSAVAVREPSERSVQPRIHCDLPQAKFGPRAVALTLPAAGAYAVRMVSTNGKSLFDKAMHGPGVASISIEKFPAGAYVIECFDGSRRIAFPVAAIR
jgi:xylan 1,4-beta-xylosidase